MSKKIFDDPAQQLFKPRGRILFLKYFMLVFFIVLGVRFWFLQVVQHDHYVEQAENNRVRNIPITAPRGTIMDREGRVLVDSSPTYTVMLYQEDMSNREDTINILVNKLGVDAETVLKQMEAPGARSRPLTVKTNATVADRAWVEAHEFEHPELKVELQPQRRYPLGEVLAHALGYVSEISEEQLREPTYDYCRPGDIIGQAGLEQTYNQILMGKAGSKRVLVDSRGRVIEQLEEIPPIPGQDIVTTIDLDIQKVAEDQLTESGFNGTVIINDPRDGGILAMVSHPSYDPNLFAGGIKPAEFNKLLDNPKKPLRNRAIQDRYPPGSTWKILMAISALEEKSITDKMALPCGGGISVGNRFVHCEKNHGTVVLRHGIEVSCDGFFYRVGLRLGIDNLTKWEPLLGVGVKTGIDLPNEIKGIVPTREWKRKEYPKDPQWKDADMVYASIGQSGVRPSPIQMMCAITGIGMKGEFYTPHLFKEARKNEINADILYQPKVRHVEMKEDNWKAVMDGMWLVVNGSGTAHKAKIPDFDVCGKTGTAQVVGVQLGANGEEKEHAWFIGFAPKAAPEIGGVVLAEHAGHGGDHSAPIIRACFEEYLRKKKGLPKDELAQASLQAGIAPVPAALKKANTVNTPTVSKSPVTNGNTTVKAANGNATVKTVKPAALTTSAPAKPTSGLTKPGTSVKPASNKPSASIKPPAPKPTTSIPVGNKPGAARPPQATKPRENGR